MQQNTKLHNVRCYKTPNVKKIPIYVKKRLSPSNFFQKNPHLCEKKTVTLEFFSKKFSTFLLKFLKVSFLGSHRSMTGQPAVSPYSSTVNVVDYVNTMKRLSISTFIYNKLNYFWLSWTITREFLLEYVYISGLGRVQTVSGPSAVAKTG